MALQQAFVDSSGNPCPESYWIPAQINLGFADQTAYLVFVGFRDVAAYTSGKVPLPGAVKTYVIRGEEFNTLYQEHIAPGGPNISQMVFAYAKQKQDTPDPADPTKQISFFAQAVDVP